MTVEAGNTVGTDGAPPQNHNFRFSFWCRVARIIILYSAYGFRVARIRILDSAYGSVLLESDDFLVPI